MNTDWRTSVELLLGTGVDDPDSDVDSTNDGDDANPLSPGIADDDLSQIRQAVFTLMFATCSSQDAVVMAGSGEYTVQEYHGFSGVVLRSQEPRTGWVNITKFDVDLRSPEEAVVSFVDYVGSLAAKGRTITVRKTHGHWVATELSVDWLS